MNKDPNVGVFINISGHVSDTLYLDWSRIYSVFDNDDFSSVTHDQAAYLQIRNSWLHCIVARPPFMPYTGLVKWPLDHVDPKGRMFHDMDNTLIA